MQQATATLVGIAPYSQGKYVSKREHPEKKSEGSLDWDYRIREHKAHYNASDEIVIPAMALKNLLADVTKQDNQFITGKKGSKWNSVFKSGILVPASPVLLKSDSAPWNRKNMTFETMLVGQDTGSASKKNEYCFPTFRSWMAKEVLFMITDERITRAAFEKYLTKAGIITGLGRFRIGRGGIYGAFQVEDFRWE
jgi:hypothetical protein